MNEGGGGIAHDIAGQGFDLTLHGTTGLPTFVPGPFGGSGLNFVAANQHYAQGPSRQVHPGADTIGETIVAWLKPGTYPGSDTTFYNKSDGDSSHGVICTADFIQTSNQVALAGTWPCSNTDATVSAGGSGAALAKYMTGAHQVAFRIQQSNTTTNLMAFLDGIKANFLGSFSAAAGSGNNLGDGVNNLYVGRSYLGAYYQGIIDHLLVFNGCLSDRQIQELYAEPFAFMQAPKRRIISQPLFTQRSANIISPSIVTGHGLALAENHASIVSPSVVSGHGIALQKGFANISSPSLVDAHGIIIHHGPPISHEATVQMLADKTTRIAMEGNVP